MKTGINFAPVGSYDTPLFNDLLLQAQEPRLAPNWSPGGHELGSAMTEDRRVAQGMSWTTLRDGSTVPCEYLAGEYRNLSTATLFVDGQAVAPQNTIEIATVGQLQVFIDNQTGGPIPMPKLARMNGGLLLQPAVVDAIREWDFVRTMQAQSQHLVRSRVIEKMGPCSDIGISISDAIMIGNLHGKEVHLTLDFDTCQDEDALNAVLLYIRGLMNDGLKICLHVMNEVWNSVVFPESARWINEVWSGDFWLAMRRYAELVTFVKQRVSALGFDFEVHMESNQHIDGLTETLRENGDFDVMQLNGYLYLDSGNVDEAEAQLEGNLDAWADMTELVVVEGERWGLYEKGLHVRGAGTSGAAAGANEAKKVITRSDFGKQITAQHLQVCEDMGCESVAAYCFEREPRDVDPKAVFEFGIRQGLLSGDRDGRMEAYAEYMTNDNSVPKDGTGGDGGLPPKTPASPLGPLLTSLESNLRGAADDIAAIRAKLKI